MSVTSSLMSPCAHVEARLLFVVNLMMTISLCLTPCSPYHNRHLGSSPDNVQCLYESGFCTADGASTMDKWWQLPTIGKCIGGNGRDMSTLWKWTHTWRVIPLEPVSGYSAALYGLCKLGALVEASKSQFKQSLALSCLLVR